MKTFLFVIPMVVAGAVVAACASETPAGETDASPTRDAPNGSDGGACVYTSFKGETVSCPATGLNTSCPWSKDGCNATFCLLDGTLTQEAALCICPWSSLDAGFPDAGRGSGVANGQKATAPDGCSVCTCKIPPGGNFKGFVLTCDRSACP
jgi:hypothetical protein